MSVVVAASALPTWAAGPGLTVDGQKLTVRTATIEAVFDGPALVSLTGVEPAVQFVGPDPAPHAVDLFYLHGTVAVWAYYVSRLLIGVAVGITVVPRAWYVRGPLLGALLMAPTGFFSLATQAAAPFECSGTRSPVR